jgi:hypothetical protein
MLYKLFIIYYEIYMLIFIDHMASLFNLSAVALRFGSKLIIF